MKNILLGVQESTIALLKKQLDMEIAASAQYLTVSAWCDTNCYVNSAEFFRKQSDEERDHMLKIFQYLLDIGVEVKHPEIKETKADFKSLKEVFELSLKNEQKVTAAIQKIADHCNSVKDYSTLKFIEWYIKEQIEEEKTVQKILDYFDLLGEDKLALYHIDKEIGKL